MSLITLRNLGVTFGEPLFENLDLTLGKGDRIGLVAANGRGKSTLLRIIANEMEATWGERTTARGLRVGLVSQNVPEDRLSQPMYRFVRSALAAEQADTESWRVDIALEDLAVAPELWQRPLGELSGGWQRVALLARIWVREPDVLLMDEPTNHLDLARIGILQSWLTTVARQVPFIVASHDRAFLDAVTNRTVFLRRDRSHLFAQPYTAARRALEEADAAEGRRFDNQMAKATQLRRQAARLKNVGINSGSDLLLNKTRQLTKRAGKIEDAARPAYREGSAGQIRLSHGDTHSKALVSIEEIRITAPDGRALFATGPLWINRGDKVVLLGANGAGKTMFVSRIIGALPEARNGIRVAPSVVAGVSDQALTQLEGFASPMAAVTHSSDVGDRAARALLAGAGMHIALQDGPIGALSGGQRARLAMLLLRLVQPNFHILDEPTNHLDIEGQEALEAELLDAGATALLVSHDRTFVRTVATRFWQIERKRLKEVPDPEAFFAAQTG